MPAYQAIAEIYDLFMSHVDYEKWVSGLESQWKRLGMMPDTVLDAGCGTGGVLVPLLKRNYQVLGIDNAPDMLAVCQEKLVEADLSACLLEMDIRRIKLPEPVDAVVSLCDTMNYLTNDKDLERCIKSVFRVLKPGGSFIFDLRTPFYYEEVLGNEQWVQREDDLVLIWENDFTKKPLMNMYLTFFAGQGKGLYRKYEELHRQKCFHRELVEEMIKNTGFELIDVLADLAGTPLEMDCHERMYFIARKPEK